MQIRVKIVPGASRSRVMGMLGDRVKIAVAAPPENGKANRAVCELLAQLLHTPARNVNITTGHTQPQKTVLVAGCSIEQVAGALGK